MMTKLYHRQRIAKPDGKTVQVIQKRGHLSYCVTGCCCGHTNRGFAPVPVEAYKQEWLGRNIRNIVHLTKGGCLGPCALANVASLVFDGRAVWFHSISTPWQVKLIFDYIEAMIAADSFLPIPPDLAAYAFNYYDWEARTAPLSSPPERSAQPLRGITFFSHADTDILTMTQALVALPPELTVRALSLQTVRDEAQLQIVLDGSAGAAQILVLRLHGSLESVTGFERLQSQARERGQHLLVLSGLGELNPTFAKAGSVSLELLEGATAYAQAGGVANFAELCKFLSDRLLLTTFTYEPPMPTPEHGLYHPNLPEKATLEDWHKLAQRTRPSVAVLFYRAHLLSGNTAFVDALLQALEDKGLNAVGVFTSSLRQHEGDVPVALKGLTGTLGALVSTLSFAVGEVHSGEVTPAGEGVVMLERLGIPVIQAVSSGMARAAWSVSSRGLNALDTAMNVALPEFDGRIISTVISFKERGGKGGKTRDGNTLSQAVTHYEADLERCKRVAGIVEKLVRLRHIENGHKRVAFVLTNSNAKASSVGNAVGLDAPASLLNLLRMMRVRGYQLATLPPSSDALMAELLSRGSYDDAHPLDEARAFQLSRSNYLRWFEAFPETVQNRLRDWWGSPTTRGFALRQGQVKAAKNTLGKTLGDAKDFRSGAVEQEPFSSAEAYFFAGLELGNAVILLQPPRGYGLDPNAIYHTPDLPPTHHYSAFYRWLVTSQGGGGWGADAIVHVGKHGTLEWLPGKGVGLSQDCFPDALLGDVPLVYPFIINDPGEGSQSKRRAHAVVVDHLTPPLTHAETYGELAELAQLVNEYYALEKLDPSKLPVLQERIWTLVQETNLKADLDLKRMLERDHGDHKHDWDDELTPEGVPVTLSEMGGSEVAHLLEDIDGYLCELGLAQIRDGLHILGDAPPLAEMVRSLTRLPNAGVPGLQGTLARLYGFELNVLLEHTGERLHEQVVHGTVCYSHADVLEALDNLALDLCTTLETTGFDTTCIEQVLKDVLQNHSENKLPPDTSKGNLPSAWTDLTTTLEFMCNTLVPNLERCPEEVTNVLGALEGRFIPAGPSGAPSRGMAHILPTGRNFYAVDPRALPSMAAWQVGEALATNLLERYLAETGAYPEMVALSAWGTSAMRTHGDDIAEVFALLGVRPVWNTHSRRTEGIEVVPLDVLARPRIDVTLRISGFFRDAFPHLLELLGDAVTLVTELDEPLDQNFPRAHYLRDCEEAKREHTSSLEDSLALEQIEAQARYRVFGAKPGSYGAGILPLIDTQRWQDDTDFATAFLAWGGYAYGRDAHGVAAQETFAKKLRSVQVVAHNQDNREHDIFDSDDYFQFMGGMVASVRSLSGEQPKTYFGDSSHPDNVRVRDLREEVLRVYRSRVVNPKWLAAIQRHGYKGGLELAATIDYLFGFDATAHVAPDFVYEGLAQHYALGKNVQDFLRASNPWALKTIAERLLEAAQRELWEQPSASTLEALQNVLLESEAWLEERSERV